MKTDKEIALDKLNKRLEFTLARFEAAKRLINSKHYTGEADREWLRSFAIGKGLDIACGDFPTPGAETVDINFVDVVPVDYFLVSADELTYLGNEEYDYIVTNYFECFPNPLKALHDWRRCLKAGGRLAIVCRDADTYVDSDGALSNKRRLSTFNISTLKHYVTRAGFTVLNIEKNSTDKTLRIVAGK